MIGIARLEHGLYHFPQQVLPSSVIRPLITPTVHSSVALSHFDLWHFRLGHSSLSVPSSLTPKCSPSFHCKVCPLAKLKRLPFQSSTSNATVAFDLLHVDIWGPYSVSTIDNHKFFLTIVDDFTRFTWTRLLVAKSDARQCLIDFCIEISTQFNAKVKTIRTDNGLEFSIPQFY
ncbi:Retrovirus-related Pol polyprotein from transposon RE2, partial [Linum grandiflorum]